jgi:hypothetical protein
MGIAELYLTTERKIGRQESKKETIFNMFKKNFADDLIADIVDVPLEYVRNLRLSLNRH